MAASSDYYETLGIKRDATPEQIKAAYRRLARQLHPDVNKSPDAAQRFARVQEAYDALSDPRKRRNYDEWGTTEAGFAGAAAADSGPRRATHTWSNIGGRPGVGAGAFDESDAASIFEEFFGGAGPFARGQAPGRKPRQRAARGGDVESDVVLDFMEAIRGGTRSIRLQRGDITQTVEVTIPPAVAEGTKLRMRGLGLPGSGGGQPGDLILTVHVAPHEWFRREGLDIEFDLPLTIAEAALGTTVRAPTLTGRAELVIPPGASSGTRFRLKGQGVRAGEKAGDLYAVVKIVGPAGLSEHDRRLLEDLGRRLPNPRTGPMWH